MEATISLLRLPSAGTLLALVVVGGCAGAGGGKGDSGTDGGSVMADGGAADGGAADGGATADCTEVDDVGASFGAVEAVPAERIPMVLSVRYQPAMEGEGWVRFQDAAGELVEAPAVDQGDGQRSATLLGLHADSDVDYQLVVDSDAGRICSPVLSARTGSLPAGLPLASAATVLPDAAAGGYSLVPLSDGTGTNQGAWLTILDRDGAPVWIHDAMAPRMRLSLDGQAVIYNDFVADPERNGSIYRVPLGGGDVEQLEVEGGHFDFVQVSDGVYATFDWDVREYEGGVLVAGERLVEVTADGDKQVIWNIFDDVVPDLENLHDPNPGWQIDASDWSHLNHLFYDADDDAYYFTSRYLRLAWKVDRSTGATDWILGPHDGDFEPAEGSGIDFDPHSAVPTASGVLIFDTNSPLSEGCSALSEFSLDLDAWTAEQIWLYHTDDCLLNSSLGNGLELPGGNRLLALAVNGQIDEVTPDRALAWRLNVPAGWVLGYADRVDSLYPTAP